MQDQSTDRVVTSIRSKNQKKMTVTVTDPEQHGEGRSMYTTYKVTVIHDDDNKEGEEGNEDPSEVRRRYSEFQWLYNRLQLERPGAFIPIIPHQRAVQKSTRFSEELIEERKVKLEQFLQKVTVHPELKDAPSLATFLFSGDELFAEAKKDTSQLDRFAGIATSSSSSSQEEDTSSNTTNNKGGWRARLKLRLHKTVTAMSGTELEKTPDEPEFEAMAEYVHDLDVLVKALSKHASSLTKSTEDTATNLAEIGQIFEALSQAPSHQNHPIHALLNRVSQATANVSNLWFAILEKEDVSFDEPMKDLSRDVQSANIALSRRNDTRLTYTTWQTKVKHRKNNLDKLRGRPGTPEDKVAKAVDDLKDAESSAALAKTQLDEVSKRIRREIKRFRVAMDAEIRGSMLEYARIQIESCKSLENEWETLVPDISSVEDVEDLDGGDGNGVVVTGVAGASSKDNDDDENDDENGEEKQVEEKTEESVENKQEEAEKNDDEAEKENEGLPEPPAENPPPPPPTVESV